MLLICELVFDVLVSYSLLKVSYSFYTPNPAHPRDAIKRDDAKMKGTEFIYSAVMQEKLIPLPVLSTAAFA